ncbi:GL10071 [Drosophila persimilis]|uniref:GL10071 n=1 Tax=Drosophila persimilis TaxID=7234 RepID=B4HCC3_DROPE|nr:GL10071 [Drosophila persimilis]
MWGSAEDIFRKRDQLRRSPDNSLRPGGQVFTLGHLLIGQAFRSLPDALSSGTTYTKRCQRLSELKRRLWQAWSKDYLPISGSGWWSTKTTRVDHRHCNQSRRRSGWKSQGGRGADRGRRH